MPITFSSTSCLSFCSWPGYFVHVVLPGVLNGDDIANFNPNHAASFPNSCVINDINFVLAVNSWPTGTQTMILLFELVPSLFLCLSLSLLRSLCLPHPASFLGFKNVFFIGLLQCPSSFPLLCFSHVCPCLFCKHSPIPLSVSFFSVFFSFARQSTTWC